MALNRDRVGATYDTYRYEVSREKIREYAAALGEDDPGYFSDGDDCVAPPTFAACFTIVQGGRAVLGDPALGLAPMGGGGDGGPAGQAVLHGGQTYEYGPRPLRPGDVLVCTPRLADIRSRGSSAFLTVEVDCRFDGSGERAVRSEAILVVVDADGGPDT